VLRRSALARSFGYSAAGVVALGAIGCASQIDPYTADADTGSTHALITIERSVPANGLGPVRGAALAGFVRVPPAVESKTVMRLVGLTADFPPVGQCRLSADRDASHALAGFVEFVEAGDIRLQTPSGLTELTARAFPTITDLVSGVVYTSRDRSADTLPAASRYSIFATGTAAVPGLTVNAEAPRSLEGVALGGVPLSEIQNLSTTQASNLTWATGDDGSDIVVVELSTTDGTSGILCSFRDDAGTAAIPANVIEASGPGRLALHRVRSREFLKPGIDRGELRFDFTLRANLNFVH
jgi:hypothetical protein